MRTSQLVLYIAKCPEEYTGSKHIEMPESGGSIGRNAGSTVALTDHNRFISGTHCLISVYGDTYYISDVSTNGTLVNGNRILKNQPISIQEGDSIALGRYEISVAFEQLTSNLDIAADIVPDRDSTDPLVGLGEHIVHEEQQVESIEELFMETKSEQVDTHDPVAHLDFAMQIEDDHLIRDENTQKEVPKSNEYKRQIPDDSFSIYSEFETPNLIPEDWMAGEATSQPQPAPQASPVKVNPAPQPEPQPAAPRPQSDMVMQATQPEVAPYTAPSTEAPAPKPAEPKSRSAYWEEVTQPIPAQSNTEPKQEEPKPQTMAMVQHEQQESVQATHDAVHAAFFQGLGISDSSLQSADPKLFQQMGACLRLCIDKLQKDLSEVEDLKQQGEQETLATNLTELMLTLNQQNLLSPNELIEQMLDELDEHRSHYNQAVSDAIYAEVSDCDPEQFAKKIAAESKFVTRGKLWSKYENFYHNKRQGMSDTSGAFAQKKIKEQYHKNLKVKHA